MSIKHSGLSFSLAAAIAAALAGTPVAQAQEQPAPERPRNDTARPADKQGAASDDEQSSVLPTIVVTANKRRQNEQDVAMSMSVIGGYKLERIHATSFSDYLTRVPGVSLISGGVGQTQIVIRGIASGSRQPNASVGTYIDGAPFGSSTVFALGRILTPNIDPADLVRVEVLRGPQGTLYGANTIGGLVKFVTRPPDASHFGGYVALDVTSVDGGGNGFGARGMLNVPVVDEQLALRFNWSRRNVPGYVDDIGKGVENANSAMKQGARAQLLWTPNESWSLRLSALSHSLHSSGAANGGVDVNPHTLEPLFGPMEARHPPGTGLIDVDYQLYNATLKVDLVWAELVSLTSYQNVDLRRNFDLTDAFAPILGPMLGVPDLGVSQRTPITQNKFTEEVRLQSRGRHRLDWRIGLYYTHEESMYHQRVVGFDVDTGEPLQLPTLADLTFGPALFTEKAIYADLTWHFTPRFSLQLGARYTHDETEFTQVGSGILVGPSNFTTTQKATPATYLVSPSFQLSDDVLLYARVATGFRPGGPNLGVPPGLGAPTTFEPDELVNYEAGLKSTLLDHRMTFNIDAFYIDWSNIQLLSVINGIGFLSNGGKARVRGIEAAWGYRPVAGLTLSASASWTDAELAEDTPPGLVGHTGDPLPYVADINANIGAEYSFPIGSGWSGYVGGNYRYVGSRMTNFQSVPNARYELPSYDVLDLRAGVNYRDWSFGLYLKNATDSRGITLLAFQTTNPAAGPYSASYVRPRTLGVSARFRF